MKPGQAEALLARYATAAEKGEMIEAGALRRDYEALVGHKVAASTVYRLLAQAGWRKVTPRPVIPAKIPLRRPRLKKTLRRE